MPSARDNARNAGTSIVDIQTGEPGEHDSSSTAKLRREKVDEALTEVPDSIPSLLPTTNLL
jgi:hypothetical protein